MNSDIDPHAQEIDALLQDFAKCLRRIDRLNADEKRVRYNEIAGITQRVRTAREAYLLELRGLSTEEARPYQEQLDSKMSKFKNLTAEYEWKRHEVSRDQLLQQEEARAFEQECDNAEMTREQVVQQGDEIQDKTMESINRMKKMVGETEQIGAAVVQRLDEQTDQLGKIHEDMNDVEYNIKRAKKTLKNIARSAVTDRLVQVGCALIFVVVVVIIIMFVLNKKDEKSSK